MTRGPLADSKFRVDFRRVDNYPNSRGSSHKDRRKEEAKKKKEERDQMLGEGADGSGLGLGPTARRILF